MNIDMMHEFLPTDPKNKKTNIEKKLISSCGSSNWKPRKPSLQFGRNKKKHTINVNEAQQQFARQDAKEATNNGSQKLTRAMDTLSWPASQRKQTNKHVPRQTTTKGKHQQFDMWVYQQPKSSFFSYYWHLLTIWSRVELSRFDSLKRRILSASLKRLTKSSP